MIAHLKTMAVIAFILGIVALPLLVPGAGIYIGSGLIFVAVIGIYMTLLDVFRSNQKEMDDG